MMPGELKARAIAAAEAHRADTVALQVQRDEEARQYAARRLQEALHKRLDINVECGAGEVEIEGIRFWISDRDFHLRAGLPCETPGCLNPRCSIAIGSPHDLGYFLQGDWNAYHDHYYGEDGERLPASAPAQPNAESAEDRLLAAVRAYVDERIADLTGAA